jgi:tetratricopeptide (TPR) repeat protein
VPCTVQGRAAACDNPFFTWQFFPPGMARASDFFVIPREKKPGTFRIFVLGESAAQGDPEPSYSFSRYLEVMLRERFPAGKFEVVNAGIVAINSHVILPIARDLARRQGDLFILYIGNNEVVGPYGAGTVFTSHIRSLPLIRAAISLKSTRIGEVIRRFLTRQNGSMQWRGMEMFLNQQVPADSPGLKRVYDNFRANLQDIIDVARNSGAHVLVSTVATNLRDLAPFASMHNPEISPEKRNTCEGLCKTGLELEKEGKWAEALKNFLSACALDGRYAEAHFGAGRSYLRLGDDAAARAQFVLARDLDTLRFRADSRENEIIRQTALASGPGVELMDSEAALEGNRPNGIPGSDVFYEHAHLKPHGNYLLARAMFERIVPMLPEEIRRSAKTDEPPSEKQCEELLAFTGLDRRRMAQIMLDRLGKPPFTNESNHDEQVAAMKREASESMEDPKKADSLYQEAIAKRPDDVWVHYNYGLFLSVIANEPDAGAREFGAAVGLDPYHLRARDCMAEQLVKLGRFDEAVAQYRVMLEKVPYYADGWLNLVRTLQAQGRLDEAANEARRGAKALLRYGDVRRASMLRQAAQELAGRR